MKLLKVIRNPITDHLPIGCQKYCTSFSSEKRCKPGDLVNDEKPVAIVIGAMAHGQVFLVFVIHDNIFEGLARVTGMGFCGNLVGWEIGNVGFPP